MRLRLLALLVIPNLAMLVLADLLVGSANADLRAARDATMVAELADHIAELEQALAYEALAATALNDPIAPNAAVRRAAPPAEAAPDRRTEIVRAERLDDFQAAATLTDAQLVAFERHVESLPGERYGMQVADVIQGTLTFRTDVTEGLVTQLQILDRYARIRGLLVDTLARRTAALGSVDNQDQIRVLVALIEMRSTHLNERVTVDLAVQYGQWAPGQHSSTIASIANQTDRIELIAGLSGRPGPQPSSELIEWREVIFGSEAVPDLPLDSWDRASDLWLAELTDLVVEAREGTLATTETAERSAVNVRNYTVLGVIMTLLAALGVAAVVGGRLVRRVSIIKAQALQVGRGGNAEPVAAKVGGNDELAQLARAFDDMTSEIETRIRNQWVESSALEAIAQGEPLTEIHERAALLLGSDGDRPLYRFTDALEPQLVPVDDSTPAPDDGSPELRTAIGLVAMARQRDAHLDELAWQASRDELTGLLNRASIIDRALSDLGPSGALVYVDLDRFKEVNDAFGHHVGDVVLEEQARRLDEAVSANGGLAGRLGGDEFLIVLPSVNGAESLQRFGERLVGLLSEPVPSHQGRLEAGASVGAVIGRPDVSALKLLNEADAALYEAKRRGRNTVVVSTEQLRHQAAQTERLRRDVSDGLERGEFVPWFQPIFADGGRSLVGVEALARWQHPERGPVGPGEFLPVLEELNLLPRFDLWMFEAVCRQVAAWRERRFALDLVNYNVSTEFLESPDFLEQVEPVLDQTGCPPGLIVVEVTESGLMTDIESSSFRLQMLRGMGIRVAVDDFGQGYSSLAYLSDLPVDLLKIDRRFIDQIDRRPVNQAIAAAVIALGRSLDLQIVAEGVERQEELQHMADVGCELFQGFLLGRPGPAAEISALLANRSTAPERPSMAAAGAGSRPSVVEPSTGAGA